MDGLMSGHTAVVTGGAQGIGAAIAKLMSDEGAAVAVWDVAVSPPREEATEPQPGNPLFIHCDVSDEESVRRALADTETVIGGVTTLVNNAGITRDRLLRDMTLDDWDDVMGVNLRGVFLATKAVAVGMCERHRGSIINISSLGGKVGTVGQCNYSASKAGIIGFTKAAAKELSRYSVRVNAIQPGLIETQMTLALRPNIYEKKLAEVPLGRAGQPDEIAWGCLFLASDMSSYVTGSVLEIGGGRYM